MTDPALATRGSWAEECPTFSDRMSKMQELMKTVPLMVLVWGPGPGASEYSKRDAILKHLRFDMVEATTSEEIVSKGPEFKGLDMYDAEHLHVDICDVIFVLIVRSSYATGSPTEVARYRDLPNFASKAYLIVPKLTPEETPQSFLSHGWRTFDSGRKFEYTEEQFADCNVIRSFCMDRVLEARASRFKHLYLSRA